MRASRHRLGANETREGAGRDGDRRAPAVDSASTALVIIDSLTRGSTGWMWRPVIRHRPLVAVPPEAPILPAWPEPGVVFTACPRCAAMIACVPVSCR